MARVSSNSPHLHLLRHADAGDPARWNKPDAERPLSDLGQRQADRLAAHLSAIGFKADAILSSPKVRAVQTAEPLAKALGLRVRIDDALAGSLSIGQLEDLLTGAGGPRNPILVGHDPDFSDLLAGLIGAVDLPMKKGAFARLEVRRPLQPGTARLRWLIPPDALGR
jgi:phosphohistidine phosphatase